ncbi:senecionine N-oxygenase-like [Lissotriton helveticus]
MEVNLGETEKIGLILHSHDYRCPDHFTDKTVVVLGAGPSGIDIALEICTVAKQVILSHHKTLLKCPLPANLQQAPSVQGFSSMSVHFQDGSLQQADVFIFCTGYNYRFPFLMHQTGLQAGGVSLPPLYKHLIHPELPNLFFIGLCTAVCPFILFDCQVQYCLAVLSGSCRLPPQEVMAAEVDKEYQHYLAAGKPPKNFVKLDSLQEGYYCLLAEEARFKPVPPVIFQVYEATSKSRAADIVNYKTVNLHLLSDEDWELV